MRIIAVAVLFAFLCLSTACGGNSPEARMALIREALPHVTAAFNAVEAASKDKKVDVHRAEFKAAVDKLKPIRARAQKMDSPSEEDRKKIHKALESEYSQLHNHMQNIRHTVTAVHELRDTIAVDPALGELSDSLTDIAGPNPSSFGNRQW